MSASPSAPEDIRPLVARLASNRGLWLFAGVLAIGGAALFGALESRRAEITSPSTALPAGGAGGASLAGGAGGLIAAPPPLSVPGGAGPGAGGYYGDLGVPQAALVPGYVPMTLPGVQRTPRAQPVPPAPPTRTSAYYDPSPDALYRQPAPQPSPAADDEDRPATGGQLAGARVGASRFQNPATTVPQGAVIQAVLETALDSNRPGFVRAVVSRDVRSFDGSRVLIPRGSRLFGEYKADLAQGQSRAFVQWQRLTRPDGVQIAVDSPAADPLGRAGVGGKVDTHFFQRFSGALLQSTLDVGVGVATRSASKDTVVVGLPGSTQSLVNPQPESIKPTVRVKHGATVSVFVARDLDFSAVEP